MTALTDHTGRSPDVHWRRRSAVASAVRREGDAIGFASTMMLGAGLSLAATGFTFGENNNVFHLPIVAALYDAPQFTDDAFIQSLRHFAAGPWRLLEGADRFIGSYELFLTLAILSRLLSFAGFLACGTLLGVRSRGQRSLFVVLLATTELLKGVSHAGGGALFVAEVSHSEIANGFILLSVAFAVRGRLDAALAFAGLTFFCNAFMGVWALSLVAAIASVQILRREISGAQALRRGAMGGAAFFAAAAPVLANILGNPELGAAPAVDYRTFLESYWPDHFLIWSLPATETLRLAMAVALAAFAFHALGRRTQAFQVALGAACALYAAGVVAPLLTSAPAVLNLHLLRVGAVAQMLAALAAAALAARWATGSGSWRSSVAAPALVLSLCLPQGFGFAPALIYAARFWPVRRATFVRPARAAWMRCAAAVAIIVALALQISFSASKTANFEAAAGEWAAVADWAASATPPDALFLPPVFDARTHPTNSLESARRRVELAGAIFEHRAQRRLWVDFKRGAAAMWAPSYHAIWRARIDQTLALDDLSERRAYAVRNEIDFVIDICAAPDGTGPAFRTAHLCVFASSDGLRGSLAR